MITLASLDSVSFSDCPITDMAVNVLQKHLTVSFDFVYMATKNAEWEPVDDIVLSVTDWETLSISKYVDSVWVDISLESPEVFKEILEVNQQPGQLLLEGFSVQSGDWLKYDCNGLALQIAMKTES